MLKIDPARLKQLREAKGWTQDELANETKFDRYPKIDKRTISRLERGKQNSTHPRTIRQIARALGVEQAVLTGDAPIPENRRQAPTTFRSAMQISSSTWNALYLIYERYHVRPWQVVEFAPFLFCWAAEASLRDRRKRLQDLEVARQAVRVSEKSLEHMCESDAGNLDEKIRAERESIEQQDLWGYFLEDPGFASYRHDGIENPFARFLERLADDFSEVIEFQDFSSIDFPGYVVCAEEAARFVGGDELLARRIIQGVVSLKEMPDQLFDSHDSSARADWVREKEREFLETLRENSSRKKKEAIR
ncbi:helix-turn-helix domain-containing protein [Bradyrhizobium sp. 930_D9_N1_4]|uniref:helix-turn-helix domain-containing protein n=1 Tax=Bradyrhizobium sp. 930_D9_N1_4 TaxID=3240374 RepID=UPI003F8CDF55